MAAIPASPPISVWPRRWMIEAKAPDKPFAGGMHGYDHEDPTMVALFIANGPAFRSGVRLAPFANVDVAPLLRDLIGCRRARGWTAMTRRSAARSDVRRQEDDLAGGCRGRRRVAVRRVQGRAGRGHRLCPALRPQPFHLSDEAAAATHFGRLSASGWHTASMAMAMIVEHFRDTGFQSIGSPGVDELRWTKPVFPGDTLHAKPRCWRRGCRRAARNGLRHQPLDRAQSGRCAGHDDASPVMIRTRPKAG